MIEKRKIVLGKGIAPEKIVENQITSLRFNVCDKCHLTLYVGSTKPSETNHNYS